MSESHSQISSTRKYESGFTLIELSIVLVIIGLIVGGILTGQDLIKAAEQRATIAQIEKYNTAVNTFRNKYNGIPGDLAEATAVSFGLLAMSGGAPCTTVGMAGCGDGNGLLDSAAVAGATALTGETLFFWRHLSDAGLVDGSFGACDNGAATGGDLTTGAACASPTGAVDAITAGNASQVAGLIPLAKLARSNYLTVAEVSGINYFGLSGMGSSTLTLSTAGAIANGTNNLTPLESYNMDKKVDDGLPNSGSVQALNVVANAITSGSAGYTPAARAACNSTTAYNVNPGNTPSCSLRFRFN